SAQGPADRRRVAGGRLPHHHPLAPDEAADRARQRADRLRRRPHEGGQPHLQPGGVGVSYLRTASQETWKWVVSIDQAILVGVRRWESTLMTRLMRLLSRMGDPAAWAVVGLTLGAVAGARDAWLLGTGAGLAV